MRAPFRSAARWPFVIVVVSVALAACSSGGGTAAQSAGSTTSSALSAPTGLHATVAGLVVKLTWTAPAGSVDKYEIFRGTGSTHAVDGPIGTADGGATSYQDKTATPGTTYTYAVQDDVGSRSSRAFVEANVVAPPLSTARLDGDFTMTLTVKSASGIQPGDSVSTHIWHLSAKCGAGPCDTVWSPTDSLSVRLNRNGATYKGSDTGEYDVQCGSSLTNEDVTLTLKVTGGQAQDGEWIASDVEGTLTEHVDAANGCATVDAVYSISGRHGYG